MNLNCIKRLIPAAAITLAALVSSCDKAIYDDEGDCSVRYGLTFTYTMNMKFADAFPAEVDKVTAYIFDKSGKFVTIATQGGDDLSRADFVLSTDVAPGVYDIVVWAEGQSPDASPVAYNIAGGRAPESPSILGASLPLSGNAPNHYVDRDIVPLYHAYVTDVAFTTGYGDVTIGPLDLTKDTNRFSILLQNLDGTTMMPGDFTFEIIDANNEINYRNEVTSADNFTYRPWSVTSTSASFDSPEGSASSRAQTTVNGLLGEIGTGKLTAGTTPQLVIHRTVDNKDIIRINLLQYLLMVKGEYNRNMSDQEYLDRMETFTLMFFIDADKNWYSAGGVFINGWHIVPPQNSEL